ncbi:hypothetical protein [Rhodococcus qingshengii]|uniref:hypothetical protein n=1 Tax=Rhodococcus qingshengii TaxID=334542 RepID=UPI002AFE2249|nr:hypothetical protein [Rhodococcus qingshengii]MEA1795098.1 hypothetical protein [Rhodococcus qingshengii]
MRLPAPDTGLSSFPVSDSATVSMPGPDSGVITFPPAPIPIVVITVVTVVDVATSVETLTVPWYVVETVVDVATGVEVLASVTIEAETAVDVETTVIQIFDSVTAETVVDVATSATASVSAAVAAETIVDVTTEVLLGTQRAIVNANTTVDVEVEVISIPVTSFTANTTVDVATSATAVPVGVVTAETVVDVETSGLITSFAASGMAKNGDQQLASSSTWSQVTTWTANANSIVAGNALQVRGTGTATIEVGSAWTVLGTANKDWRVLKNGTVVWTKGASTGQTFAHSFTLGVADGDLLTCEAWNNSGVAANRTIASGANTYLRVVPV